MRLCVVFYYYANEDLTKFIKKDMEVFTCHTCKIKNYNKTKTFLP